MTEDIEEEPKTYKEAISSKNKEKWEMAMKEEIDAVEINKTWTLEPLPSNRKAIGSKWVTKLKEIP
jgi:pantothenate synthetase